MVRMSRPCSFRLHFSPPFHKRRVKNTAFSIRYAMVQSTINSQCGQLQSARSHAIRSTFQARFSSASDTWLLSTRNSSVLWQYSPGYRVTRCWDVTEMDRGVRVCEITAQLGRCCSLGSGLIVNGQPVHWNSRGLQTTVFSPAADVQVKVNSSGLRVSSKILWKDWTCFLCVKGTLKLVT